MGPLFHCRSDFKERQITIKDRLVGKFNSALAFWYLHPAISTKRLNASEFQAILPDKNSVNITFYGAMVELEKSFWHPEFGKRIENTRLVAKFLNTKMTMVLTFN